MTNILDEFRWRELLQDSTEGLEEFLAREKVTAYIGFDPTAKSLHVGSLVPILGLARLQRAGHSPIAIAGGGTGMIGDPSGRTLERKLLTLEEIEANLDGIQKQLERFLDFKVQSNPARVVNNADWLATISLMEFMRDIGKHFTVNAMIAKESVRRRLESEDGISVTEFSYLLLQAYDYLMLYDRYDCRLQMGGSDQWGNITAGIDLIRRLRGGRAYGLVFPLVMSKTGAKFGKSEAGTVWLDPEMTSPYRFYQYWLNTDDKDVVTFLKYFTWRSKEEIAALEESVKSSPEKREAQHRLADDVTAMLHGETELAKAHRASQVLFGGEMTGLGAREVADIFADVPSSTIPAAQFDGGMPVVDLFATSGIATSKGDARRSIEGGGMYLNNVRIADAQQLVSRNDAIEGQFLVLRKGRKQYHLVRVV
ncbi:MAG: tyrosine--tRNA ligase [Candidatus Zixiibacteriota bacterium]